MLRAARAGLHMWEEPCISGERGSGTVFFSGCPMKCVFCQNYRISAENFGMEITSGRLAEIFLQLQHKGAHNINLVNPVHFLPWICEALDIAGDGLKLPVVYNSGGYERVETLKLAEKYVDIYLPDFKYISDELAVKYSSAPGYSSIAAKAICEMYRQKGPYVIGDDGILLSGVVVRHLVLPGHSDDSIKVFRRLAELLPPEGILVSVMSQYTPFYKAKEIPGLDRKVSDEEYERVVDVVAELGFDGYTQEQTSAEEEYTPDFDLSGIK